MARLRVWESDRLLFVWESGFISPREKNLVSSTVKYKLERGRRLLFVTPLFPEINNSLILDKACVRKVYWLLANKEWEWVYLLSSTTILNCYEETFPALAINQAGMETAPQNYFKKEEKMRRPHFTVWSWQVTKSKTSWVAHSWLCTDT